MTAPRRDERLDVDVARWLASGAGQRAVTTATEHLDAGAGLLAAVADLRSCGVGRSRSSSAVTAARARRVARLRYPDADQLLFTLAGLEQASHPVAASRRASRFARGPDGRNDDVDGPGVVDLCCGEGSDCMALATEAGPVVGVDVDGARLVLARHNARVRDLPVLVARGDATRAPLAVGGRLVHADPSRRSPGRGRGRRGARRLADYRPAVGTLVADLVAGGARGIGVVLSPAVSLDDPDLPPDIELEFVQVDGDLLEAVAWVGELRDEQAAATATVLTTATGSGASKSVATRSRTAPAHGTADTDLRARTDLAVRGVGEWLIELAPAVVRARLHDELGAEIDGWRLARHRVLLSADDDPGASVWWRRWRVEAALPARASAVRTWLRGVDDRPISIATHGVDVDVEAFWRDAGRPERGPSGRRIHLVRLDAGARAYACLPPGDDASG